MELEDGKKALILRQGIATCHSFLHFILKPTKKEIGKGMGLFNSGEIKTKLLCPCLGPAGALQSVHFNWIHDNFT